MNAPGGYASIRNGAPEEARQQRLHELAQIVHPVGETLVDGGYVFIEVAGEFRCRGSNHTPEQAAVNNKVRQFLRPLIIIRPLIINRNAVGAGRGAPFRHAVGHVGLGGSDQPRPAGWMMELIPWFR
ncbi:MAG: hypothetical protein K9N23_19080 [Akkermansiaceae bacterium]|nr:hypothetical protein [Akkermansiaceae bacterium]